jgi:hypothetical protein
VKRSPVSGKTPSILSESTNRQLSTYALAAGAAGVSLLALADLAEGKIVYTPANVTLGAPFKLDLNGDGIADFYLTQYHYHATNGLWVDQVTPRRRNQVFGNAATLGASALAAGARIGHSGAFSPGGRVMDFVKANYRGSTYITGGPWANGGKGFKNRYLGLKFFFEHKVHFGWARLTVVFDHHVPVATLTGYAYETVPNKTIIAGKTKGPEELGKEPDAILTAPAPKPASLGLLALGSCGLSIWRREESVRTTQ